MKKYLSIAFTCLLLSIFIFVAVKRYALGSVRYFDPDEFMYVNWAYHVFSGNVPYKDFMMIASPLYVVFLAPLFMVWSGIDAVAIARVIAFLLSIFLAGAIGVAYWTTHKSWVAIVPATILLILPMPSDKLLEIRPDILALLIFLIGFREVLLFWSKQGKPTQLFWGGVWLSTSLLVLQKTGVLVATVAGMVIFSALVTKKLRAVPVFLLGLGLPLGSFSLWALTTGQAKTVFYSVTWLTKESILGVARFNPLGPTFFFSPNPTYYGESGLSIGLIVNHTLWVLALILAAALIMTNAVEWRKEWYIRMTPALLLVASVIQYLYISPLKFTQYLLPAAVFVAWFTGEWVELLWRLCKRSHARLATFTIFFVLFTMLMTYTFFRVHSPKFNWTNDSTYQKITRILATIPKNEYVFDLEGRTIYYPYPYYVCCLPIGQFDSLLLKSRPPIREALRTTKTKYIYQAEIPRIRALPPEDVAFIRENYTETEGGDLLVAKYW